MNEWMNEWMKFYFSLVNAYYYKWENVFRNNECKASIELLSVGLHFNELYKSFVNSDQYWFTVVKQAHIIN